MAISIFRPRHRDNSERPLVPRPFVKPRDAHTLTCEILNTAREPFLVLSQDLRVIAASRSFYAVFMVEPDETLGKMLYELSDGAWNIPGLRKLFADFGPEHGAITDFRLDHHFPQLGRRKILLNASQVSFDKETGSIFLLAIEDITRRTGLEAENEKLLEKQEVMLSEVQHRVANSLQIIASIIMIKAKTVESEETRLHLHDAHHRVISVAAVQKHLYEPGGETVEVRPYLSKLCAAISESIIVDDRRIRLTVRSGNGRATCNEAESIGLIVTELVINALKHAFNEDGPDRKIDVSYETSGSDWKLSVIDNGAGKPDGVFAQPRTGLGTGIVKALAKQLDAQVQTVSGLGGTIVTVTHATFAAD